MTAVVAPSPKASKGKPHGRSYQPGIYAGRYLTRKMRERRRDAEAESARRRAAFHRGQDIAYRRALGLGDDEPLPAAIGQTVHSRAPLTAKNVAA